MELDPTARFTSRADAYARYRPSYPVELLQPLQRECGLKPESVVADIGSGTGLLSRVYLDFGCEVFGVEPNAAMRAAGERELAGEPRFHSVDGRAESTSLPAASVDFVTAGQALHWFDAGLARAEFRRILKPGGWVALVWNERLQTPGFMADYDSLARRHARELHHVTPPIVAAFFGHSEWRLASFPNQQEFDWEGLQGRQESTSYSPPAGSPEHQAMVEALHDLFLTYQRDGSVTMLYETRLYYGGL